MDFYLGKKWNKAVKYENILKKVAILTFLIQKHWNIFYIMYDIV